MKSRKYSNHLIHETSPYLLQHAHNPVNWYPWGEEALQLAKKENKPIIVSIGYSACHWCHVMERESFENESVAEIMNQHFIAIKVDREERPDVDQVYIDAIQAMGIQGGWPLNVFLTPEQKPFYGGTYFPAETWIQLLKNVATAYKSERYALDESAEKFTEALNFSEIDKFKLKSESFSKTDLGPLFDNLGKGFDPEKGGMKGAPKFPMPAIWSFVLHYFALIQNKDASQQLELTLKKMALGGIYDQIGGGFSRYSVDDSWFAPHFEKMLYDNGQLVSLYSKAFLQHQEALYKDVVYQTLEFIQRELTSPEGGFYAALDADSEGEEGKFYTWEKGEFDDILGEDATVAGKYFNVKPEGNWEKGWNILHVTSSSKAASPEGGLSAEALHKKINAAKFKLLKAREKRIRPGLDDKILAGWNGLMLKGIIDAYVSFTDERFLTMALSNANFIKEKLIRSDNGLYRSYKSGKATLHGYLEDYASVIGAFKTLYEVTFDEQWLQSARELVDYTLEHFFDEKEQLFFFTDNSTEKLIARKKEIFDNVIPSSNALMATNLFELGILLDLDDWKQIAIDMVAKVKKLIVNEPRFMSTWAEALLKMVHPTAEVVIVGPEATQLRLQFGQVSYFNVVFSGTSTSSELPLLANRGMLNDKTTIYVCFDKACKLPTNDIREAIRLLDFDKIG